MHVRCCCKNGAKVSMQKYDTKFDRGCHGGKTYAEAALICSAKGLRLCTQPEMLAGRTSGTGCGYDTQRVWTSTARGTGPPNIGTATQSPSFVPTLEPTPFPTFEPTLAPTALPKTAVPTFTPTSAPTAAPSMAPSPGTTAPSMAPTLLPTPIPTMTPTLKVRA